MSIGEVIITEHLEDAVPEEVDPSSEIDFVAEDGEELIETGFLRNLISINLPFLYFLC